MTTPGTMNNILRSLRERIEVAGRYEARSQQNFNGEQNDNYTAGYDSGYAKALKDIWQSITGDEFA